jgi:hypothetical protein
VQLRTIGVQVEVLQVDGPQLHCCILDAGFVSCDEQVKSLLRTAPGKLEADATGRTGDNGETAIDRSGIHDQSLSSMMS